VDAIGRARPRGHDDDRFGDGSGQCQGDVPGGTPTARAAARPEDHGDRVVVLGPAEDLLQGVALDHAQRDARRPRGRLGRAPGHVGHLHCLHLSTEHRSEREGREQHGLRGG
jgi:hypothetical protein